MGLFSLPPMKRITPHRSNLTLLFYIFPLIINRRAEGHPLEELERAILVSIFSWIIYGQRGLNRSINVERRKAMRESRQRNSRCNNRKYRKKLKRRNVKDSCLQFLKNNFLNHFFPTFFKRLADITALLFYAMLLKILSLIISLILTLSNFFYKYNKGVNHACT